jgi:hypothetical protein
LPVTLEIKSNDSAVKEQRETTARRVIDYFSDGLPPTRLLCFLDDDDPAVLKAELGAANRGLYGPIHDSTPLAIWPDYVIGCILVDDGISLPFPRIIDDLVYLYGSTCANEVGLTMTLAHELQHAIQHYNVRQIWAVNSLVRQVPRAIKALNLMWADIPTELDARAVSKRVALHLFTEQRVSQYIDRKIAENLSEGDVADWQFVRTLTSTNSVDLVGSTHMIFERLKDHKPELETALQRMKEWNPEDFGDIELNPYFAVPT